jgi:hypothetical protein
MSIGKDLLDVPFGDMIFSMANAIASSQRKLDAASLRTLRTLAGTKFDWIPEVTEVLSPKPLDPITVGSTTITPTGVDVKSIVSPPIKLTLLQAGLVPQFYQFTESIIEVKISLSNKMDVSHSSEVDIGLEVESKVEFGGGLLSFFGGPSGSVTTSFSSHVNIKNSISYSYSAEGSSLLRTTLKPVPPPARFMPRFITVNALVSPPIITTSE